MTDDERLTRLEQLLHQILLELAFPPVSDETLKELFHDFSNTLDVEREHRATQPKDYVLTPL